MSVVRPDPPVLSPEQFDALPTCRTAYSDRISARMAAFCELARVPVAAISPALPPGSPKTDTGGGRKKLEELLSAGRFRLVEVFNKDEAQAFLAVRHDRFAVLAFRGTETPQDRCTDLNAKRVPLPGVQGVTVHRGFLEAFMHCREEIKAGVDAHVPSTLPPPGTPWAAHSLRSPQPFLSGITWRPATLSGRRELARPTSTCR